MWYLHTIDYYPIIKRNKALVHKTTWMTLKGMMLSEKKPVPNIYFYDFDDTIFLKI